MSAALAAAFAWQAVALAALVTFLGRAGCVRRWGDFQGHLLYFGFFFLLLGLVPAVGLGIADRASLGRVGLTLGRVGHGLACLAAAAPIVALLLVGIMRDRGLAARYPLSREATTTGGRFALYEAAYVAGYYTAWEFCFRGLLFLPLVPVLGLVPALAIQTALSTLLHIGSPDSEVWGAVVGGVAFGLVAYLTGSILYPFAIHAALGMTHDVLRRRRLARAG
jgi:membrane protease YdiL (CAAX protease family)